MIVLKSFLLTKIGLKLFSSSKSGKSLTLLQFKLQDVFSVYIYNLESTSSSILTTVLGNFFTISYIYLPDTTISPHSSISSISFLSMNVLIAISLSVLIIYKPSCVKLNFIQLSIGIKFLLDIPFIT